MENKTDDSQLSYKPRPNKSAVLSLMISIIALLVSLAGGYLAYSSAYLSYQTKAEIDQIARQAQAGLETFKNSLQVQRIPPVGQ